MTRPLFVAARRLRGVSHWLAGASLVAMAVATSVTPASAQSTPFGSMVGMQAGKVVLPNGTVSQWTGANRPTIGTASDGRPLMSIEQTQQKALLDWEQFKLQTNEVLEFQQQSADWIAVNRVHGAAAAEIHGEIRAKGRVFIFNDNGVLIGPDAKINTRQLVTGQGVSDVLVDGATTTIVQSRQRATLNWTDMSMTPGQVLKFQQEKKDWIALNRSMAPGVTTLGGTIEAPGHVYLVAPQGLAINGSVKAQQVIASSLNISDAQFAMGINASSPDGSRLNPIFTNSWDFGLGYIHEYTSDSYRNLVSDPVVVDPNDPLRYNVTVGRSGAIETGEFGKVMLFGPRVTNQGRIKVIDEGQVILGAGENIYLKAAPGGRVSVEVGAYSPLSFGRVSIPGRRLPEVVSDAVWQAFYLKFTGVQYAIGDIVPDAVRTRLTSTVLGPYVNNLQFDRARNYVARNEGVITSLRGGSVDFRGLHLQQMGAIEMTSTALFRGQINFATIVRDYMENPNQDYSGPDVPGHGTVVFGRGSLTQITPDLESRDAIPVGSGSQSVGTLKINAGQVHLQEDSLIYMPSGKVNILLDASDHLYDNNRGAGNNRDNEDGTRFMMERGATIDLSGWRNTVLAMGSNQVTGKLFAAQLSDSPLQRDGPLYRQEISVDRRYGTNLANWAGFDNLNQGTLAQFLTDGGSFTLDVGDDFIMKPGSVIDVSGGLTTYESGYVYTTLLRRLDGSIIDIREADPDELYMGKANEWVQYDTKWGKSQNYYIPLMSSLQGKYETSYVQGGAGGKIEILAPDVVLQGTLKGAVTAGRYQRANLPKGGSFILNRAGPDEGEYVSNNILIAAIETTLPDSFGLFDKLSDVYGDQFGKEFDRDKDKPDRGVRTADNATLTSAAFFNRSTMGSYSLSQGGRAEGAESPLPPVGSPAVVVEHGVNLNLANGASFALGAGQRMQFFGSIRTEGGAIDLGGLSLEFADDTRLDTRGSWYSDYEVLEPVTLNTLPRINGGKITLEATGGTVLDPVDDLRMILPASMVIDSSAGAWVNRQGKLTLGKGGDLSVTVGLLDVKDLDLSGLDHARAYGLGGNGGFSLKLATPIYIGDALPAPEVPPNGAVVPEPNIRLLSPSFFSRSGFSSIALTAPSVTVGKNVRIEATTASLRLREGTLLDPAPPAFWAPSGTDVFDIAEPVYLAPELRSSVLRRGMDLTFTGSTAVLEGAFVGTEVGGRLNIIGSANIQGVLSAPAGQIKIQGSEKSLVVVGENARLLAPGVALITKRGVTKDGRATVGGEVLPGGQISIDVEKVVFEEGAVLDVSGASAAFDFATDLQGSVVLKPVTVSSDAGSISIAADLMDINSATYRAFAGGPGARGGAFSVNWGGRYGPIGAVGQTASQTAELLELYFQQGYFYDADSKVVTSPYNIDFSTIQWESALGFSIPFPVGYKVSNRAELLSTFADYAAAAYGPPPVFMIGDTLPPASTAPRPMPTLDPNLESLFSSLGYVLPTPIAEPASSVSLSTARIAEGGFSSFKLAATPGVLFVGDTTLGGKKADGSYIFDSISINAQRIMGQKDADVRLEAGVVNLSQVDLPVGAISDMSAYDAALAGMDVQRVNANTRLSIAANTLLQVQGAEFYGFSDTVLTSQGDIRLLGLPVEPSVGVHAPPTAVVSSSGKLTFKADQLYAATGHKVEVTSEDMIHVLPQDVGTPLNCSPYEAAAQLTLKAPSIIQAGIVRSPLGSINLVGAGGTGSVVLAPGSITSTSGDGHVIPYGFVNNGDTWVDPYTQQELTILPAKSVNISGASVDLQEGALIDVSGGGDLYAREFVSGIGGANDWLTGYRDADYKWISSPNQIFAVLPSFEGDVAPYGVSAGGGLSVGDKIYLAGGSGLKAGYYTLLPAEFALLPGGFRVTADHGRTDLNVMMPGQHVDLPDGSSIQSGYRYTGGTSYRDTLNHGFMVMGGDTLRLRSQYNEVTANSFFTSEAFLKKALRSNRPIGDVPRTPLDGGSVVLKAARSLNLDSTLKSAAAKGGRGGFADIDASRIAVVGANTDLTKYAGYLVLDSDRLNAFGAESLLLGGTRRQGQQNLELSISGQDVVIDNNGSVLKGPELLFAARDKLTVESGSVIETSGTISGNAGDLRILPAFDKLINEGQPGDTSDDVTIHAVLDQGAVIRVSSGPQVSILRNTAGVDAMAALRADPAALAAVNAGRASLGLEPIVPAGNLVIADGAVLRSSRSIALDATVDTLLSRQATLSAAQISAAASRISIGAAPVGTTGLVFAGGSAETLASAADLTLKSYSTIDIYGGATLKVADGLRLDSREIRVLNADGATAVIGGKSVTLANTSGPGAVLPTAGTAKLLIDATNIYLEGGDKRISGVDLVTLRASQRVIGRDTGTLYLPGDLAVEAANFTVESGGQTFLDAAGAVTLATNGQTNLPPMNTFGATLGFTGDTVTNNGRILLTGGTVNLRARDGDVVLADGSSIDVTSSVSQIFDTKVGVGAGTINLTSDRGDVRMASGAMIDVSGTTAGGDAGRLNIAAGQGHADMRGQMKGASHGGARSGSFSMVVSQIADFSAFNAALDSGGFMQARRFEVNQGDLDVTGTIRVQNFSAIANQGSINVTGVVRTTSDSGGRIQISAAEDLNLAAGAQLLAKANAADGSGGTVFLETTGRNGGQISVAAGSLIDVSGTGEGGRLVRLRAPQLAGGDVAIAPVQGSIVGARQVIAEGFKVYDNVSTIDQSVINTVSADANSFMAGAAAIQARLGSGVTVQPGIELRSSGDMTLATDWDLHTLRFNGTTGVLTLRAAGDLLLNANLSDGFDGAGASAALLGGPSWTLNLAAGANITSPDSLAVLPIGQLAAGKGSVIVGGTPDTLEYYRVEITDGPRAGTTENRLYMRTFDGTVGPELDRDAATGQYIDPDSGALIAFDPVTDDYVDTQRYARVALPEYYSDNSQGNTVTQDQYGNSEDGQISQYGQSRGVQWDNSTGYIVRTGTAGINIGSGRDIVLQYKPSVIYTAGDFAAPVADFAAPTRLPLDAWNGLWGPMSGYYLQGGGDILLKAGGDIVGAGSDQLPNAWLWRYGNLNSEGNFATSSDMDGRDLGRAYDQTTWFVRFDRYQAGIGALGGGNIEINAAGDITNLTVNLPNTGRVSGGYDGLTKVLHTSGGGDLAMFAGGDIGTGNFYVADGQAQITAGGAFTSTRQIDAVRPIEFNRGYLRRGYDLYTILFTSSGDFRLQSGGDLNIDGVMDPLAMAPVMNNQMGGGGVYGVDDYQQYTGHDAMRRLYSTAFFSYTPDARIALFSAGGDVNLWNNYGNIGIVAWKGGFLKPQHHFVDRYGYTLGSALEAPAVWPGTLSAVAAAGDVVVKGGMYMAPSPTGNLELLAHNDVRLGQGTRADDPFAELNRDAQNFFPGYNGIFMSQSRLDLMPSATNGRVLYGSAVPQAVLEGAGFKPGVTFQTQMFTQIYQPDLHAGDTNPAKIYAAVGDVVTTAPINLPKALLVQAGDNVYFPDLTLQHNNASDYSLVRAGNGLYFSGAGQIAVAGPGRLEVETGHDLYIPSNAKGITSGRVLVYADGLSNNMPPPTPLDPNATAADIAISTGFNQTPSYQAFEDAYLNPEKADGMADFLLDDAGDGRKLSSYLFDRVYNRGGDPKSQPMTPELRAGFVNYVRGLQGLKPLDTQVEQMAYVATAWSFWADLPQDLKTPFDAFLPRGPNVKTLRADNYLPEAREGLVNYVRQLQGLDPLDSQADQLAYLDTAWSYWSTLSTDRKTPFYRDVLFMELRTTGREANTKDNPRSGSSFRGYDAIKALFPGAEKPDGTALGAGESRWAGDFETYASRVISSGGGKIEVLSPGGAFKLANSAATPGETGQPAIEGDRGDALRAGVVTTDGGGINIMARQSATLNQSRVMTTKGGNILIWSSYGDIAAGKGAKTSISAPFYDYNMDAWDGVKRVQAGLPTGAGIQTVASVAGSPVADVDLIAPNGVVDAGDAGISVSGNFNVFAIEILGADNIDVSGVSTGLPAAPAAAPFTLDNLSSKSNDVEKAIESAVNGIRQNAAIVSPSIIEVQVTGFGDCQSKNQSQDGACGVEAKPDQVSQGAVTGRFVTPLRVAIDDRSVKPRPQDFDIAPQPLADAVRAVGRASGVNILYDADTFAPRRSPSLRGRMTPEQALEQLLGDQHITAMRVGAGTIVLRRARPGVTG